MKALQYVTAVMVSGMVAACSDGMTMSPMAPTGMNMMGTQTVFPTNGEAIFRTGRNLQGIILQDLARSQMPMPHSCSSCHGFDGAGSMMGGMMGSAVPSIRFRDLVDPRLRRVPYTEEALMRFLDDEVKPDGTAANTGVAWRVSARDKADLIAFLKTL